MDALVTAALLGSVAAVSLGVVKLVLWCVGRVGESTRRAAREAAFVAQARAELAATGWTPNHETLYQAEIAATKCGDLLAAARFAEEQERAA
ncbi:hypothetical protein ACJ6WJ_11950 [Stenotrophomonas maltophilia]|uniref:hypothetical protein n=1 Tax=Stenotrophomonas maltophilia TaxID=40324 RepID=UPI0012AF917C|nr:hypothetical protein [Stenotrophomonas maltophilia]MBA0251812.1 hypothetical protein [Stenotrophomonas maltophilia]MBA0319129.1 hypothetical protein [Stenotrophomonas maltophilia]MBH1631846.1 hypothetical protein [Stenotrophomonas maltophilia]MCU1145214.1 hypothetical protein [Stenotrophomonas maltophilia]QGL92983.1 hypothetical protein FEO92_11615 [Stenotrophomonas maltophilia]